MSENRTDDLLRIATRAAHIGVWEWDLRTGAMTYSDIAREICGFPQAGPVTFEMVLAVTHPDDLPSTRAASARALDPARRENVVYNYRIRRADTGETRRVIAYGEANFEEIDGDTVAVRYVGTLQDITADWRMEQQLAGSEARLRLAIDAGEMAVWEIDVISNTVVGSPELNRICGFPPDATPTIDELNARYAPGELQRVQQESAAALASGNRLQSEFNYLWPDGTERWLLLRAQVILSTTGAPERVIGVLMDVTERKRREVQLELVSHELRHRIKNSLAVVGALAQRAIMSKDDPQAVSAAFMNRLSAIGHATDLIFANGDKDNFALKDLVSRVLGPFITDRESRFTLTGSDISIPGSYGPKVALALHELCTNALKYGALSVETGSVAVAWGIKEGMVRIVWQEAGGPPVVAPTRTGFGSRLLQQGLFALPESIALDFDPQGLRCEITMLAPERLG